MSETKPKRTQPTEGPRCEGHRRYGGAFTLGPVRWEQCRNTAIVLLTLEQDCKVHTDMPACAVCWEEGRKAGLKQIEAKPIVRECKAAT